MKSKIKIMKSRQEVTDEEIHRYMDFDNLLLRKDKYMARQKNIRLLRNTGIALTGLTVLIMLTVFVLDNDSAKTFVDQKIVNDRAAPPSSPPQITNNDSTSEADQTASATTEEKTGKGKTSPVIPPTSDSPIEKNEKTDTLAHPDAVEAVYKQAEPVNGYPDLYGYFDRELTYPEEAMGDSIQGVVTIVFSINTSGKTENIQIENSLGKAFDQEVLRVVGMMPPWNAASYNGKPVKSKVSLPLTFQLKKLNTQ
jgi:TonB family protein